MLAWPRLTGARLLREIRELGYGGGKTVVHDFMRTVRSVATLLFKVRFETAAGQQAQVDFAEFRVRFADAPQLERKVWLFAMVLGHSRYLWAQFVLHQDLATVLRCHMEVFEHFGDAPREILYDRMKTEVLGEADAEQPIIYNSKRLACAPTATRSRSNSTMLAGASHSNTAQRTSSHRRAVHFQPRRGRRGRCGPVRAPARCPARPRRGQNTCGQSTAR